MQGQFASQCIISNLCFFVVVQHPTILKKQAMTSFYTKFTPIGTNDTVAEWLRRQIRNLLEFLRVGSNPAGVDILFVLIGLKSVAGRMFVWILFYKL